MKGCHKELKEITTSIQQIMKDSVRLYRLKSIGWKDATYPLYAVHYLKQTINNIIMILAKSEKHGQ